MKKIKIIAFVAVSIMLIVFLVIKLGKKRSDNFVEIEIIQKAEKNSIGVQPGDKITLHYTNFLSSGAVLDSTQNQKSPFTFILGKSQVLRGWNEGLLGAQIGEKRKVITRYQYAYGERGAPPKIPPKSDIITEFVIINIER
jgi:FKBP-type peptidyl-prolyl cis-trans isomerase